MAGADGPNLPETRGFSVVMPFDLDVLLALSVLLATVAALALRVARTDVVALGALVLVGLLGLVPVGRALAGFSSPAVVTVAGMFVISSALSRAGVAELLGRAVLRWSGREEVRLVVAVTLVSGFVSGFVNNVGVVAMMLPVVLAISRRTEVAPSKLLIPMALGAQLGGFTTLIGAPPNLLASDALAQAGHAPFRLFDFTPLGLALLASGTLLIALAAPRRLPNRLPARGSGPVDRSGIRKDIDLERRLFFLRVPDPSPLDGRTLAECLLDPALGVRVLAIQRGGRIRRAPGPDAVVRAGDRMLVQGAPDRLLEVRGRPHLVPVAEPVRPSWLEEGDVRLARARVPAGSSLVGRSPVGRDLRARDGVLVLALRRGTAFEGAARFLDTPLHQGDELLLQGSGEALGRLAARGEISELETLDAASGLRAFGLTDRVGLFRVTDGSALAGRPLVASRLGDAVGVLVLAVVREEDEEMRRIVSLPAADTVLSAGDFVVAKASEQDFAVLRGLQDLEVDGAGNADPGVLEGHDAGFVEAVLAPRSGLLGRTLRQIGFHTRFGMHVVAIVREGATLHTGLRDEVLRFGDALLLYGPRERQRALASEPDLILLSEPEAVGPTSARTWRTVSVALLALVPVIVGWIPVQLGVTAGALLMVLLRCLTAEEAYRAVDLPTLVLVAGMMSLGAALDETGAIDLLGDAVRAGTGSFGPRAVLAMVVLVTAAGAQIMPGSALVVLMAPIAISSAGLMGASPEPFVLSVAVAGTSLASPVSQPPHALVMAPAGYRIGDYLRLGIPMTVLVLTLTVLLAPIFMPF